MVGSGGGVEMGGEGSQLAVAHLPFGQNPPGQGHCVHHDGIGPPDAEVPADTFEETDVERGVVGNQHTSVSEVHELWNHVPGGGGRGHHGVRDPREYLDHCRNGTRGAH